MSMGKGNEIQFQAEEEIFLFVKMYRPILEPKQLPIPWISWCPFPTILFHESDLIFQCKDY
jgi:hypothetical protein